MFCELPNNVVGWYANLQWGNRQFKCKQVNT